MRSPLTRIVPSVVTDKSPLTFDAAKSRLLMSFSTILLPLTPMRLKSFASAKVISLFVVAIDALPKTEIPPLCVTSPLVVKVKSPVTLDAPNLRAFTSFNMTSLALQLITLKSFALSKMILFPAPGENVASPATKSVPLSVIVPLLVITRPPFD